MNETRRDRNGKSKSKTDAKEKPCRLIPRETEHPRTIIETCNQLVYYRKKLSRYYDNNKCESIFRRRSASLDHFLPSDLYLYLRRGSQSGNFFKRLFRKKVRRRSDRKTKNSLRKIKNSSIRDLKDSTIDSNRSFSILQKKKNFQAKA